ncbi:hypothetical protein [uncultured Pontibacter sp.]|uniref:hypothetical protein n=1 Tax=uncultured Pontibacter sp. TaxID=453356 RepID=UPI00261AF179|nr:hypothetical protein [uncultured Pontibacter sp.]
MNAEFNLTRLGYFIRRQLFLNINAMWIAIAAVVGVLLVISGFTAYFNPTKIYNLVPLYLVVLFVGGYVFTSKIFSELHSPQKSYAFLTLPVSTSEKLLGAWIIAAPLYLLTALLGATILMLVSALVAGQSADLPNAFSSMQFLRMIGSFLVTQTFFFLGAVAFRGNNFMKTLLAMFIIAVVLVSYTGSLGYMLFGGRTAFQEGDAVALKNNMEFITERLVPFLYWYVLGPFLLVVSFFKLKERQV